ncbi:MAG: ribonuclease R [Legionellaceae bacterium]|nr:ribonuclease R [Legionellaceae bacterium]
MKKKKWKDPHAAREASNYEHPIPSRELILEHIQEVGKPRTYRQLSEAFELDSQQKDALRYRLKAMLRDGQLVEVRRGAFALLVEEDLIAGHIQANRDGHGFLVTHDGSDDLFLPARQMRTVFDGDEVLARVTFVDRRGRREGAIAKIIKRRHERIVGRYFREGGVGYVEPTNKRINQSIVIPPKMRNGAKNDDIVVANITSYPTVKSAAVAEIVEVLGDHMAPGMEIDMAVRAYDIPDQWPSSVRKAIKQHNYKRVAEKDKKGRRDLRDIPFVTIDGEDAKDFDDAVFCEPTRNGWRLYVAIADVSHYVEPESALDNEAILRGNSVYFPGEVIPMLPKVLSNGLCSLNPKVDRLALVCEMNISKQGELGRYQFYPATIKSRARLTYTEVGLFVENKKNKVPKGIDLHIKNLYQLYQALHQARVRAGAISFETTESKVIFGRGRKIKKIVAVHRNDAHRLIEECMLMANIAAAKFLIQHKRDGLFRVHSGPKADRIEGLQAFLGELGLHLPGHLKPEPKDYVSVLDKIKGRPDEHLIQMMLLRSMSQAFYTPENVGHFALAFDEYTHFTSPIRRYPDLVVHRIIKDVVSAKTRKAQKLVAFYSHERLDQIGEQCSMTERRADEATRDALAWLKCEYMLDKIGQTFSGVISGVTNFGVFVELADIYVEGLVHVSNLPGDQYQFDVAKQRLRGQHSGACYHLGEPVKVKVVKVNLDDKRIDFILATPVKNAVKKTKKSKRKRK